MHVHKPTTRWSPQSARRRGRHRIMREALDARSCPRQWNHECTFCHADGSPQPILPNVLAVATSVTSNCSRTASSRKANYSNTLSILERVRVYVCTCTRIAAQRLRHTLTKKWRRQLLRHCRLNAWQQDRAFDAACAGTDQKPLHAIVFEAAVLAFESNHIESRKRASKAFWEVNVTGHCQDALRW